HAEYLGSAANDVVVENTKDRRFLRLLNPRNLPEVFGINQDPAAFLPESEEYLELILSQTKSRVRMHRLRQFFGVFAGFALIAGLLWAAYSYTQTRYYIGESANGKVSIFRGIHESFGSLKFSQLYRETSTNVNDLTLLQQDEVRRTIAADSLNDAYIKFDLLLSIEGQ
ncbi:MAG: hypothetical protein RL196_1203, partial [Actinomycetota bacterium]